jgi:hypothetical protein
LKIENAAKTKRAESFLAIIDLLSVRKGNDLSPPDDDILSADKDQVVKIRSIFRRAAYLSPTS